MQHPIQVRRPELGLTSEIPRYWYGGRPFETHFLNALSTIFPEGEAFFVRAVQHYRADVRDPELRRAIAGFAAQEGQHSHQHDRHVQLLVEQGYGGLLWRNAFERKGTRWALRFVPRGSLVATAALEHLTALLARQLLGRPELTAPMDARMAPLWQWHALEEAEHKAVAYDVMQQVGIGTGRRRFALAANTVALLGEALERTTYMLRKDGLLFDRKVWRSGLRWLLGRGGFLRGLRADYLAWYRRDFHPNQIDDGALIAEWRERFAPRAA